MENHNQEAKAESRTPQKSSTAPFWTKALFVSGSVSAVLQHIIAIQGFHLIVALGAMGAAFAGGLVIGALPYWFYFKKHSAYAFQKVFSITYTIVAVIALAGAIIT